MSTPTYSERIVHSKAAALNDLYH